MNGRHRCGESAGLTLVEIMIAVTILVLALLGLFAVILHTTRHNEAQRENLSAMRAAEDKIEELMTVGFDTILTVYDQPPATLGTEPDWKKRLDDPGNQFDVLMNNVGGDLFRLEPVDANTPVGRISFPTTGGVAGASLDENETGEFTRMGDQPADDLDLDGNGSRTDTFLPTAYTGVTILPVRIDLTWRGIKGVTRLSYQHVLLRRN